VLLFETYARRCLLSGHNELSGFILPQLALATQPRSQALDLTTFSAFWNGSYAFGERITVDAQDITVDALGILDVGKDGFLSVGGLPVGIYSEIGMTLLASATVSSGDQLVGNYRFHSIPAITLLAGQSYRVVGVNLDDDYNSAFNPNLIVDPSITWDGYASGSISTLQTRNTFTGMDTSWFASFNIASPAPVPEGGLTLGMCGIALAGLIMFRRRT